MRAYRIIIATPAKMTRVFGRASVVKDGRGVSNVSHNIKCKIGGKYEHVKIVTRDYKNSQMKCSFVVYGDKKTVVDAIIKKLQKSKTANRVSFNTQVQKKIIQ